jgi:hypothetical protein
MTVSMSLKSSYASDRADSLAHWPPSQLPPSRRTPQRRSEFASPETAFIFNTLLFLIGGFLVMWMAAGFAMLEAGLVRSKNVSMQCLKNIALYSIAGLMFWVIGYSLMYTDVKRRLFRHAVRPIAGLIRCRQRRRLLGCLRLVLPDGVLCHHGLDRLRYAGRAHQAVAVPDLHRSS